MCKRCEGHGGAGEVAVLLDADGLSGRFGEPGTVVVYRKCGPAFEAGREMELAIDPEGGLAELRTKMGELVRFLGPCKIFVAQSASGAVYFELEKAGCSVWEVSGRPEEFLDGVLKGEEEAESAAAPAVEIPVPVEVSPGRFFISIREVQGKAPFVSSKQVLQEFVCRGGFDVLEVVCDHVPPWIGMEAERRGYAMEAEQLGKNEVRMRLTRVPTGTHTQP